MIARPTTYFTHIKHAHFYARTQRYLRLAAYNNVVVMLIVRERKPFRMEIDRRSPMREE